MSNQGYVERIYRDYNTPSYSMNNKEEEIIRSTLDSILTMKKSYSNY